MTNSKLLNCPFCDGEFKIKFDKNQCFSGNYSAKGVCQGCHTETQCCVGRNREEARMMVLKRINARP